MYHILARKAMEDTFRHKGLRKKMLEDLLARVEIEGLDRRTVAEKKRQVCRAIEEVPRHCFIDTAFDSFAYQDRAFPIGDGQTISQPSTVLAQSVLLDVAPGDKILEVGTGSGYQAMVLERLGAKVYTIERQKEVYLRTKQLLQTMGSLVRTYFGDGYQGVPDEAPFDKILITCAAPEISVALLNQLKPGGRLVVPVGQDECEMTCIFKAADGRLTRTRHGHFRFVPMLSKTSVPQYGK